jgi:hypothetical protein
MVVVIDMGRARRRRYRMASGPPWDFRDGIPATGLAAATGTFVAILNEPDVSSTCRYIKSTVRRAAVNSFNPEWR